MNTQPRTPAQHLQHLHDAVQMANRAAVGDIETYCVPMRLEGDPTLWHDTRPMLDKREHAPEALDMAHQALRYAEEAGLIKRHPQHTYLVRVASTEA